VPHQVRQFDLARVRRIWGRTLELHLGLYQDETAAQCHWHVPEAHYLETWGDIRGHDGTISIQQPLIATNRNGQYDVTCTVSGGGLSGQAGAVRHGLAKALTYFEPDLRGALKRGGFLTRDSRVVERKKYGRAKARRSFQFSKR